MTKICILTEGCTYNKSDSEVMAGLLREAGFEITRVNDADIVIFNTCIVKGPTVAAARRKLKELKKKNKTVIVAGCIAQAEPEWVKGYSLIGVDQIHDIVQVVEETLNDNTVTLIASANEKRLNLPKARTNKLIEIIPICKGCLGNCAYCKTKSARGNLFSYKPEEIIKQARTAVEQGVKQIWLTAQDTGCYGKDININLPELVKQITKLEGDFMIRIGMMNPNHAREFLQDIIKVYKHPKVFKFLHLPLQSGSDEILMKMKRKYCVQDFINIVELFRKEIPEISIATDVICGFPTETKQQFEETLKLIEKIQPDVVNISKFWKMPGTEAAEMPQVTGAEIKDRSSRVASLFEWISNQKNKQWIGWAGDVVFDEYIEGASLGRNYCYKPVQVDGNHLGEKRRVKITKNTIYSLFGEVV